MLAKKRIMRNFANTFLRFVGIIFFRAHYANKVIFFRFRNSFSKRFLSEMLANNQYTFPFANIDKIRHTKPFFSPQRMPYLSETPINFASPGKANCNQR